MQRPWARCANGMDVGFASMDTAGAGRHRTPRAKSLCGYEGGIVPSTSVMFGMPNIDGGLRTAIDRNAPEAAKRRGELDAGMARATSLCGHEGGIVPSTSVMFGMPNIDGGLRAVDRRQRSGSGETARGVRGRNSEGKVFVRP